MKIYFAGALGGEFKYKKLRKQISKKRLVSYHYMTRSLNQGYLVKKGNKNEKR